MGSRVNSGTGTGTGTGTRECWGIVIVIGAVLVLGCKGEGAAQRVAEQVKSGGMGFDVLATVNGVPITEHDLQLKLKGDMHQTELKPEHRKNVLEAVVRDELLAQKAAELGLDRDERYQAGLRALQLQIDAYRRRELAQKYVDQVVSKAGTVTDDDARRWFEDNRERLSSDVHLWEILVRDEAEATEAGRLLASGMAFEEVAKRFVPAGAAQQGTPWDLGFQKWLLMPEPWRPVVDKMKPGETSALIRGPRGRFWYLRLVERRPAQPPPTLDSLRPAIVTALQNDKLSVAREEAEKQLRAHANIVYQSK